MSGKGIGSDPNAMPARFDLRNAPPTVLHTVDKPTICALNGAAAGYGMDLAIGCDIRIASDKAKLAGGFAKRGVLPESGGTWLLPRLVGWAKACEIAFTGRTLLAPECLELGLVNKVVPHELFEKEVQALAQEIADNAPLAVQAIKRMMRLGLDDSFESNVHQVYLQLLPLFRTKDFQEGVKAFLEGRKPVFEGR
jgi:enoyl-CoA hydratase/carnithine racemase